MANKRNAVFILLIVLLLVASSTVLAEFETMYVAIQQFSVMLFHEVPGVISCMDISKSSSSQYIPSLVATLRRSVDGKNWTIIKSWSATGTPYTNASIDEDVSISKGYQYKLYVTAKIHDLKGVLIETAYKNSQIITY